MFAPKTRHFLSAEDLSFIERKNLKQNSSNTAANSDSKTDGESNKGAAISGVPVEIEHAAVARFSRLLQDAARKNSVNNSKDVDQTQNSQESSSPTETAPKISPQSSGPSLTVRSTDGTKSADIITVTEASTLVVPTKVEASVTVIIPRTDLKAIVSQDPGLKHLITSATQKSTHRKTTSAKFSSTSYQNTVTPDKFVTTSSAGVMPNTTVAFGSNSVSQSTVANRGPLESTVLKTPSNIPLMIGGGLALFIIVLLVAIVVLLVRLKNRKNDDISMRYEGSNRSNASRDTETGDSKQRNASFARRESKDSNVYSEIGSEVADDADYDDDVIYYWGESEWDTDSRHNSVISLSYTAKTEMARNNTASTASGMSPFGVPKRGRRKSSLANKGRSAQGRADMRKDRQSAAGNIFCIPESEDVLFDTEKKIDIKKDDLYKKVLKEGRSQSLF